MRTSYILIKLSTDERHAPAALRELLVNEVASNLNSVAREHGIVSATIAAVATKQPSSVVDAAIISKSDYAVQIA